MCFFCTVGLPHIALGSVFWSQFKISAGMKPKGAPWTLFCVGLEDYVATCDLLIAWNRS